MARDGEAATKRWFEWFKEERAKRIMAEQDDPFTHGFRPPIWHVADELLVDGAEVVLVDPDWDLDDVELRKRRPPDFLAEAARRRELGLPKITIIGKRELWIAGSNRSSKTEYAAHKIAQIGATTPFARTWSWSDSEEKSQAKQQPIVFKYLPKQWKLLLNNKGKAKDRDMKMGYGPDGFIGNKFTAANGWKHWFNNYKQALQDVEGDQLNASWHDEERDPERVKTVRVRLGDRRGIMLVTFTSIDATFTAIVSEYETGMQVVLEVEAEWLPKKRKKKDEFESQKTRKGEEESSAPLSGFLASKFNSSSASEDPAIGVTPYEKQPGWSYEMVRRVAVAGPGSDGDQRANILHFHISDNPYYGYDPNAVWVPGDEWPIYGKRAFYLNQNIASATRTKILTRGYGILVRGALQQFRYNAAVHRIPADRVPTEGTRFHILDPCPGRNWFMIWVLIDAQSRWFVYREWPSYGGNWKSAYIEGIGDPGPWALPGTSTGRNNKIVYDGIKGPAQEPFRFGLKRYKAEIERVEGGETISERWMDSRYAGSRTLQEESATTQIEQMEKIGMDFRASPSEQNMLTRDDGSITMINELLDYDEEVERGEYSARLARVNEPRLFVSEECPNVAFALKEWTGRDGQHGACKDPADCLRYAALCDLDYIGADSMVWRGPRIR